MSVIDIGHAGVSDRTVNLELFVDLAIRKLVTREGSDFSFPPLTLGDTLLCTLRPMVRNEAGDLREQTLPVRTVKAAIGKIIEPPAAGTFTLRGIGTVVSPAVTVLTPGAALALRALDLSNTGGELFSLDASDEVFASLAESVEWFETRAAGFFTIALVEDGELTVTVTESTTKDRLMQVTYEDIDHASGTDNAAESIGPGLVDGASIPFDATPAVFAAAVNPILPAAIADATLETPSCWIFRLATGADFTVEPGTVNRLDPVSLVRVRKFARFGGEVWCEVRLIQAPLAINDGHDEVLADPPSVRRIMAGDAGSQSRERASPDSSSRRK